MRWARPAAVLAAAAALAVPGAARAATITYSGGDHGTVVYAAGAGETLDTTIGYDAGCIAGYDCVTFHGDAITAAPDQCAVVDGVESCLLDPDHSGVRVTGGSGHDSVSVLDADIGGFPAATAYALAISGGDGNDTLHGGSAAESLSGGPGADGIDGGGGSDVVDGGDGNDTLDGDGDGVEAGGNDTVLGGAGNDRLTGDSHEQNGVIGHDRLDGGPGVDTAYDDWYRFDGSAGDEDPAPRVSLDGTANDGRPGENDDVVGVEAIDTGYLPGAGGTWTGSSGGDAIHLLFADGQVAAGAGNDIVTGADGADSIDGGPGDDQISGGFGDDTITGGPGRDDIGGDRTAACEYGPVFGVCTIGSGNDTIHAQDGERDVIDCGPGTDVAYVDAIDVVGGCETVHVSGAGAPGGNAPTTGGTPPAIPARVRHFGTQRLRTLAARGLRLRVHCSAPCRLTARLVIDRANARRLRIRIRQKRLTVGTGHLRIRHAGTKRLTVRVARAQHKRIAHARRKARLTLVLTVKDGAGHAWTLRRAVKVRR